MFFRNLHHAFFCPEVAEKMEDNAQCRVNYGHDLPGTGVTAEGFRCCDHGGLDDETANRSAKDRKDAENTMLFGVCRDIADESVVGDRNRCIGYRAAKVVGDGDKDVLHKIACAAGHR